VWFRSYNIFEWMSKKTARGGQCSKKRSVEASLRGIEK